MFQFLYNYLIFYFIRKTTFILADEFCLKDDQSCKNGVQTLLPYSSLINQHEADYQKCKLKDCDCIYPTYKDDLAVFKAGIGQSDIERARQYGVHYQIIDHKLYRQQDCLFPFRCKGVEHFLLRVIKNVPDCEFILNDRDWPQIWKNVRPLVPVFSFSKTKDYADILYPAWSFWEGGPAISLYPTGIGRWDLMRHSLLKAAQVSPWENKVSKAFFRGSRTSAERDPLILLSRSKPNLVDAQYTKNQAWKSEADTLGYPPAEELSFENHCAYKYLFNFRGVAASFRFKHLFLCNSLVFHVGDEWTEFFYPSLKPWVHYIPVSTDLSEVENLLWFFRQNNNIAQTIAKRGFEWVRQYLTLENVECYWRRLLRQYARLLQYNVRKNESLVQIN